MNGNLNNFDVFSRRYNLFFFDDDQTNAPNFPVNQIFFIFEITGDAVFDTGLLRTRLVDNPNYNYDDNIGIEFQSPKRMLMTIECQTNPWLIPFAQSIGGSDFMELFIIGDPGATFSLTSQLTVYYSDPGGCDGNNDCTLVDPPLITNHSVDPVECSTGNEITANLKYLLNGELLDFADVPNTIQQIESDPHEEIPVYVEITNDGTSTIQLEEYDLKISITDVMNTLNFSPDFVVSNSGNTGQATIEEHLNDRHYFHVDFPPTTEIAPGESIELLLFDIPSPPELDNLEGQADILLEYARVRTNLGEECVATSTDAFGSIYYPGDSECPSDPTVTFHIQEAQMGTFDDCETGFMIRPLITDANGDLSNEFVIVDELFLAFNTITTENLGVWELVGAPPGMTLDLIDCSSDMTCPMGINAPSCMDCNFSISYSGTPALLLGNSLKFGVSFRGSDQTRIEEIDFTEARLLISNETEYCAPEVDDSADFLPLTNTCLHCLDYSIGIEPDFSIPMSCEQLFAVELFAAPTDQISEISVELTFDNIEDLLVEIVAPLNCNTNNPCLNFPSGATPYGDCAYILNNSIFYKNCVDGDFIGAGQSGDPLFYVRITGDDIDGCLSEIMFTNNTQIVEVGGEVCMPRDDTAQGNHEMCVDNCSKSFTGAGFIHDENGNGIYVPVLPEGYPMSPAPLTSGILIQTLNEIEAADCSDLTLGTSPK